MTIYSNRELRFAAQPQRVSSRSASEELAELGALRMQFERQSRELEEVREALSGDDTVVISSELVEKFDEILEFCPVTSVTMPPNYAHRRC